MSGGEHVAYMENRQEKGIAARYVRKDSKRQYLATYLNIRRMHEGYELQCKVNGNEAVKEPVYRRVFNEEFNLSFDVPKKAQCSYCNRYYNTKTDDRLTPEMKVEYEKHQRRKVIAREQKEKTEHFPR
ncbi:hypothetical protein MAR_007925 [Mya arenaria]|uniref:Uncharacterized protein n=1 Tax=Mya arenaria TaxID=6604 RepID=A0ABY7DX27_MYAAR|nr:hypothetical protein MAR_007925 [Mya arenaria]